MITRILSASLLLIAVTTQAKDLALGLDNEWQISPYRATRVDYFPFPLLTWTGDTFYIDGDEAGILAWKDEYNELKIKGLWFDRSYDRGDGNGWAMQQLNNRRTTMMAGVSYQRITPLGALFGQVAADTLGVSNGIMATLSWQALLPIEQLAVIPAFGLDWESARQNRYYYGVSDAESERSSLPAYNPTASLTPWIQMAFDYTFSPRWDGYASARVNFLDQTVTSSPMVDKSQSYVVDVGVNYHF
ncbi:MipA/OmpV family protein [Rahnella sp. SAP-1]|uniref:MipA/OmpV family protein n=1 Tax=Rouxiella aceris TaxID=2703884 RepID=A0A848MMA3_9GAMM|nr:MipA/OmpV family protein [Rouxiella aceris]NMP28180.1 MipA/OmpV family protein [Rouxiella aceris]